LTSAAQPIPLHIERAQFSLSSLVRRRVPSLQLGRRKLFRVRAGLPVRRPRPHSSLVSPAHLGIWGSASGRDQGRSQHVANRRVRVWQARRETRLHRCALAPGMGRPFVLPVAGASSDDAFAVAGLAVRGSALRNFPTPSRHHTPPNRRRPRAVGRRAASAMPTMRSLVPRPRALRPSITRGSVVSGGSW